MSKIYDLSWNETSFFSKLSLLFASIRENGPKIRSKNTDEVVAGYSALSSTCYSIAGTAAAQLKAIFRPSWLLLLTPIRLVWFAFTWLPLGVWCYAYMMLFSDFAADAAGGHANMTAAQLDVRQSILYKRGRKSEAKDCISKALENGAYEHTKGLLLASRALMDAKDGKMHCAEQDVENAEQYARNVQEFNPNQAARIYKKCALVFDELDELLMDGHSIRADWLRKKAMRLSRKTGSKDQALKAV